MKNNILPNNQIVVYDNGEIELKVSIDRETIWLTQKQISELFDVNVPAVSKHIKNILNQNELIEKLAVSKMEITTKHGAIKNKQQTKEVKLYNLDMILAIGYRINSLKTIEFRKWATKVLKQYILHGYVINSEKITVDRFLNLEKDVISLKDNMQNVKKFISNILEQKWFDVQPFRIDSYTAAYFCKPIA